MNLAILYAKNVSETLIYFGYNYNFDILQLFFS